jgi:hypothetical protein
MRIRRKSWLKQLRVAISTREVCQAGQVHKIRKQILSTCFIIFAISELAKISKKYVESRRPHNTKVPLTRFEIFMQNGKVGKGDVFFSRKHLYCLICIKILT